MTWSPNLHDQVRLVRFSVQPPPQVDALHSCAARHSRTAHDLYSAKICYRYHPRYGVAVQLVRYLRRGSSAVVIVRLPDNSQLAIPEWMLKPEACEELKLEAKPRISVSSLLDVRKLIGDQPQLAATHRLCRIRIRRSGCTTRRIR